MSNEQITEYRLQQEAESCASDIFDEMLAEMADDETPEQYRDDMSDRAHECADWHQLLSPTANCAPVLTKPLTI